MDDEHRNKIIYSVCAVVLSILGAGIIYIGTQMESRATGSIFVGLGMLALLNGISLFMRRNQ